MKAPQRQLLKALVEGRASLSDLIPNLPKGYHYDRLTAKELGQLAALQKYRKGPGEEFEVKQMSDSELQLTIQLYNKMLYPDYQMMDLEAISRREYARYRERWGLHLNDEEYKAWYVEKYGPTN